MLVVCPTKLRYSNLAFVSSLPFTSRTIPNIELSFTNHWSTTTASVPPGATTNPFTLASAVFDAWQPLEFSNQGGQTLVRLRHWSTRLCFQQQGIFAPCIPPSRTRLFCSVWTCWDNLMRQDITRYSSTKIVDNQKINQMTRTTIEKGFYMTKNGIKQPNIQLRGGIRASPLWAYEVRSW